MFQKRDLLDTKSIGQPLQGNQARCKPKNVLPLLQFVTLQLYRTKKSLPMELTNHAVLRRQLGIRNVVVGKRKSKVISLLEVLRDIYSRIVELFTIEIVDRENQWTERRDASRTEMEWRRMSSRLRWFSYYIAICVVGCVYSEQEEKNLATFVKFLLQSKDSCKLLV